MLACPRDPCSAALSVLLLSSTMGLLRALLYAHLVASTHPNLWMQPFGRHLTPQLAHAPLSPNVIQVPPVSHHDWSGHGLMTHWVMDTHISKKLHTGDMEVCS